MNKINTLSELEKKKNQELQALLGFEDSSGDDIGTDVELEVPYDAEKIRIESKVFPVFQINRWINEGMLELQPEFQRNTVWNVKRKSLLIESLMLSIPIPAFYFNENNKGVKTVIDGLQRLTAIHEFIEGEFALTGIQYLVEECAGRTFDKLPRKYIARIEESQLTVNILDSRSPIAVKFDIFRRINTGGIPLNEQEIRNVLATPITRRFLKTMSESSRFLQTTRNKVNDLRMDAQELCLRFVTFYMRYDKDTGQLKSVGSLSGMLDECIEKLNEMTLDEMANLYSILCNSMDKCYALFGEQAFSKKGYEHIINKVLFISWAVVLAYKPVTTKELLGKRREFVAAFYDRIENDTEYFNSISTTTSSKKSIQKQFSTANQLMEGFFHD